MNRPSPALAQALKANKSSVANSDKLTELKATAKVARDLELTVNNLKEQLTEKTQALNILYFDRLPTLMHEAGVDKIGVPPEGNQPGVDYELNTNYSASISTRWPVSKQNEAFDLLKRLKAEALIKTEVSAALPKGNLKAAKALQAAAKKLGITATIQKSVHHGTLSAWLRELYVKQNKSLSATDLAKIGGFVGPVVKPVERDADE